MTNKEILVVALFWLLYIPTSIAIWFKIGESVAEFAIIIGIGLAITVNYLLIVYLLSMNKKQVVEEVEPEAVDIFIGFRNMFSDEKSEEVEDNE